METELDGTQYRLEGGEWYEAKTNLRAPLAIAQRLNERRSALPGSDPTPIRRGGVSSPDKESTFSHEVAFPLVAAVIRDLSQQEPGRFIPHAEISVGLLARPEGRALVMAAAEQQGKRPEWTAANIVAWFSMRFTEHGTDFQEEFERLPVDERWAYRISPSFRR